MHREDWARKWLTIATLAYLFGAIAYYAVLGVIVLVRWNAGLSAAIPDGVREVALIWGPSGVASLFSRPITFWFRRP